jgi:hypothetical protein
LEYFNYPIGVGVKVISYKLKSEKKKPLLKGLYKKPFSKGEINKRL